MSFHVCVWLDHEDARIFEITAEEVAMTEVADHRPPHHIHRRANQVGQGTVPMDPQMMAEIAERLASAEAILIAGPGRAKSDLRTYLETHAPLVVPHIWGVEPSDHPTDPQIVAWARGWFRAANRMHADEHKAG